MPSTLSRLPASSPAKALPFTRPTLVGADTEQWADGRLSADFYKSSPLTPASVFFDSPEPLRTRLALRFFAGTEKLFFVRAERMPAAEIDLELELEANTAVTLVVLAKEPPLAQFDCRLVARVGAHARLEVAILHLGSGRFAGHIEAHLEGCQASSRLAMLELMRGEAKSRCFLENIANAPEASGRILVRNVLYGATEARIEARPTITPLATGSENHLDQSGLILSPAARLTALPLLSVAHNAVRASHKSSTARLDAEDRFYLRAHGLGDHDADALLLDGFLSEVLSAVREDSIRNCTTEAVHHFLDDER